MKVNAQPRKHEVARLPIRLALPESGGTLAKLHGSGPAGPARHVGLLLSCRSRAGGETNQRFLGENRPVEPSDAMNGGMEPGNNAGIGCWNERCNPRLNWAMDSTVKSGLESCDRGNAWNRHSNRATKSMVELRAELCDEVNGGMKAGIGRWNEWWDDRWNDRAGMCDGTNGGMHAGIGRLSEGCDTGTSSPVSP